MKPCPKRLLYLSVVTFVAASFFEIPAPAKGPSSDSETNWEGYRRAAHQALDAGKLSAAEDLFRQALKSLAKQAHKPDDTSACLNSLARTLTLEARSEEAEQLYKRSLSVLRSAYGSQSAKLVPTMLDLGSIYESEGDHPAAMALYNQVLTINQSHFGPEHSEVARSLRRLARVKSDAGKLEDAESDYKKAIAILKKGPEDSELQNVVRDYAQLLRKDNRASEAAALEQKPAEQPVQPGPAPAPAPSPSQSAWQIHQASGQTNAQQTQTSTEQLIVNRAREAPLTDSKLSPIYSTLADVQYQQSRINQAEPLYQNILAIDEKALGPDDPAVAADLVNLALLYLTQARYSDAEPLLKRALTIYESSYGNKNLLVIKTRSQLGSLYERSGDLPKAETYYKEALDLGRKELGPNSTETAAILNNLAHIYYLEGKLDEADTLYKWALASTEGAFGQQDPAVAACLNDYAQVLRRLNRPDDASKLEARASNIASLKH